MRELAVVGNVVFILVIGATTFGHQGAFVLAGAALLWVITLRELWLRARDRARRRRWWEDRRMDALESVVSRLPHSVPEIGHVLIRQERPGVTTFITVFRCDWAPVSEVVLRLAQRMADEAMLPLDMNVVLDTADARQRAAGK
jgi:hypothetical protein